MSHKGSQKRRARRIHSGAVIVGSLLVLLAALFGAGAAMLPGDGRIAQGVHTYGIDLSGMKREQAMQALTERVAQTLSQQVDLAAGGKTHTITVEALGVTPHLADTVNDAYQVGHRGSLFARAMHTFRARTAGITLMPEFTLDERATQAVLAKFAATVNRPPVDATAHWEDDRVVVESGKIGHKLDEPASLKQIQSSVLPAVQRRQAVPATITLPYREKTPRVTEEMLSAVDTVLGSFTTSYATSSRNRAGNVERAARAIHRVVLLPGDVFSFNDTVGQRTRARGYREAPVIVDGQLEPGIGGGICQVSTTLYNAVLLSNLEIVKRSHHSLPSHYVPPGLDATVSWGSLDFQFKNSTDAPVIIESIPQSRRLLVRILGKGPAPQVKIVRTGISRLPGRTIVKKDPTLPKGTRIVSNKGTGGLAVTVQRVIGEMREQISRDRYIGEPTIIRVGTGSAAPKPAVAPAPPPTAATPASTESPESVEPSPEATAVQ